MPGSVEIARKDYRILDGSKDAQKRVHLALTASRWTLIFQMDRDNG
jgi:hypothetical protein